MRSALACGAVLAWIVLSQPAGAQPLGAEWSVGHRLADGDEYQLSPWQLNRYGKALFEAMWTIEEGGGRPLTKGTGAPLADPSSPLLFPRNFNRVSAPDANSCAGCHNVPRSGGGGDIVANVFVLGHRLDFLTFDESDSMPTRGGVDENGDPLTLQTVANSRATIGMFGAGYIEMLARQITADLESIRDGVGPSASAPLVSKGISFGTLSRHADGSWDTSAVEGLAAGSLRSTGAADPPNLIVRPFHQAGAVISLREFTNNAYNHHHGIQTAERFGSGADSDGDGMTDEMSRAEVTAATLFQAFLPPPGRVIPRVRHVEDAVWNGEQIFDQIGCGSCHMQKLPLDNHGWVFSEPNPYNPPGNLQPGDAETISVSLNNKSLPQPRLQQQDGVTWVHAFTDFKLHDITDGPAAPNREPLDMHQGGNALFFNGNSRFLTKKLWGAANERPYFHHGQYTTLRQAILAHGGEASATRIAFEALSDYDRDSIIEFLKTLQVLPEGTSYLIVDEQGRPRPWPPE